MINDAFINVKELEIELMNIEEHAKYFELKFSILSQTVAYIFSKIQKCTTLEEAQEYFDLIEKMQGVLANLLFKYKIGMHDRLVRFIQDFDNLDSMYREYYFKKITSGEYFF